VLELNKIYNMDCLEGMKLIPDNSIDLVVTDPPYKTTSRGSSGGTGGILKDNFIGEEIRKKIQWYDGNAYINFEFGGCSRWQEGQEIYCSWYA